MIWTLNGLFIAVCLTYTILLQLYNFKVGNGSNYGSVIDHIAIVMNLAPTVLLLVAVIKVRCMVSKLRSKAILQKERLILIHTILFSLLTIF